MHLLYILVLLLCILFSSALLMQLNLLDDKTNGEFNALRFAKLWEVTSLHHISNCQVLI